MHMADKLGYELMKQDAVNYNRSVYTVQQDIVQQP